MVNEDVIKFYLKKIVKKKLTKFSRRSGILIMGFSEIINTTNEDDLVNIPSIILHVQCNWRMISKNMNKILFACMDIYEPCDSKVKTKDFHWEKDKTLFDEKVDLWLNKNSDIYVKNCYVNKFGDLKLEFSNDDFIEIMIDASYGYADCWRIFETGNNGKHLVMDGNDFILE